MHRNSFYTGILILVLSLGAFSVSLSAEEAGESFSFHFTPSLTAQYVSPLLDGQPEPKKFYDALRGDLSYRSSWFDLLIDWGYTGDEQYPAEEKYLGGRYFAMYDTRLFLHSPDGTFSATAGRGPHKDIVDTPYSVFINSSDIAAVQAEISYDSGFFFFTDRWVQLNYRSKNRYLDESADGSDPFGVLIGDPYDGWSTCLGNWLDKGANFKTFGIRLGDWRFGFQDVVIYTGRSFDPEYFFNPMPQYFVQIINSSTGRPWSQEGNAKSFMGFFSDRSTRDSYAAAQLLIDDLNTSFIPGMDISSAIKTKIAWSLGGWKDFSFGRMGFYHGGATKYTFEATYTAHHYDTYAGDSGFIDVPYSILPYEATYSPAVTYTTEDGDTFGMDYTRNYFGYKYGENNLAFLVDFQRNMFPGTTYEFGLYSSFEWILNSAKSPANPWHEYYSGAQTDEKVALLDGTVEHILRLSAALRKPVLTNLVLNLDVIVGVAFNAMKLVSVPPVDSSVVSYDGSWTEPEIYTPQKGVIEPIFKMTMGATWHIPVK